ncbi:hypothetical protein N7481_003574 [Penicillium waksmanii]|uniref:uncharacterized protein n=1 Tax=Penicillium waksmanii TaxID=69791 RepID=UPI00254895B9|nr:uncharacterized protein N7481_003574 [Penicillium waksmanii]KAJ5988364.1 hypothetical protein N7481_003574 [Penicillium waksmanii]
MKLLLPCFIFMLAGVSAQNDGCQYEGIVSLCAAKETKNCTFTYPPCSAVTTPAQATLGVPQPLANSPPTASLLSMTPKFQGILRVTAQAGYRYR